MGRHPGEASPLQALVRLTPNELHHGLQPEAIVDAGDARQGLPDDQRGALGVVLFGHRFERPAHVAAPAARERLRLVAEVAENRVVTTASALDPANQLEEHAPLVLDHRGVGRRALGASLEQGAAQREIAAAHQEEPEGGRPVATGATHLLVVGLDGAGRAQVDHRADVRPIDAHAEGVGGHHDLDAPLREPPLGELARAAVEPGMISHGPPAVADEPVGLLLGLLAGRRVDDRGAAAAARPAEGLGQRRVHQALALSPAVHLDRAEGEVRAGEAAHHLGCVGGQAEPRQDLVADDRGRGGRAGEHARGREIGDQSADLEVLRAEVVAPLADAVGLVHRDERDVDLVEHGPEAGERQPLGRDVHQPERAGGQPRHAPSVSRPRRAWPPDRSRALRARRGPAPDPPSGPPAAR